MKTHTYMFNLDNRWTLDQSITENNLISTDWEIFESEFFDAEIYFMIKN